MFVHHSILDIISDTIYFLYTMMFTQICNLVVVRFRITAWLQPKLSRMGKGGSVSTSDPLALPQIPQSLIGPDLKPCFPHHRQAIRKLYQAFLEHYQAVQERSLAVWEHSTTNKQQGQCGSMLQPQISVTVRIYDFHHLNRQLCYPLCTKRSFVYGIK